MAEDHRGDRSEPATARKRQETREKGQVARSQDLTTAVSLLAAFLLLFFVAGSMLDGVDGLLRYSFGGLATGRVSFESVIYWGVRGSLRVAALLLPLALTVVATGLLINLVQVGFFMTTAPLGPHWNHLDPVNGFRRIFSRRGFMRFLFGVVKLAIIGTVLVQGFATMLSPAAEDSLLAVLHLDLAGALDHSHREFFQLGIRATIAMLILALIDFTYQRWQFERDIMMTKEEVREELKRLEGDPKLKERRRRLGQQLALQRMLKDVPKADVVITNPVHVACALAYDKESMGAPRLVAKGKEQMAHRIRELALAHGVPVVAEPPLARRIYESTEVGEEISHELYKPVAEVLAYVYRLGRKRPEGAGVA